MQYGILCINPCKWSQCLPAVMHYEILCIMTLCIMRISSVALPQMDHCWWWQGGAFEFQLSLLYEPPLLMQGQLRMLRLSWARSTFWPYAHRNGWLSHWELFCPNWGISFPLSSGHQRWSGLPGVPSVPTLVLCSFTPGAHWWPSTMQAGCSFWPPSIWLGPFPYHGSWLTVYQADIHSSGCIFLHCSWFSLVIILRGREFSRQVHVSHWVHWFLGRYWKQ